MSGYTGTQVELLFDLPAPRSTASFTTTTLLSAAATQAIPRAIVPAQYFTQIGKAMKVLFRATVAFASSTTTAMSAGLDTTGGTLLAAATMFSSGPLFMAAGTYPIQGDFDITATQVGQAATTLQVNGSIEVPTTGTAANAFSAGQVALFANVLTGFDPEVQHYVDLFGQNSVSAAGNGYTLMQMKVYGEN